MGCNGGPVPTHTQGPPSQYRPAAAHRSTRRPLPTAASPARGPRRALHPAPQFARPPGPGFRAHPPSAPGSVHLTEKCYLRACCVPFTGTPRRTTQTQRLPPPSSRRRPGGRGRGHSDTADEDARRQNGGRPAESRAGGAARGSERLLGGDTCAGPGSRMPVRHGGGGRGTRDTEEVTSSVGALQTTSLLP